jgi:hypothetical protein
MKARVSIRCLTSPLASVFLYPFVQVDDDFSFHRNLNGLCMDKIYLQDAKFIPYPLMTL